MNCPCKGCVERVVGCHGGCVRYQEYSAERAVIREKRHHEMEITNALIRGARDVKNGVFRKSKTKRGG